MINVLFLLFKNVIKCIFNDAKTNNIVACDIDN